MEPICKKVKVKLSGGNGNAVFIVGRVTSAMRQAKVPRETITAFTKEAMSGDYGNLLRTCMKYVKVS